MPLLLTALVIVVLIILILVLVVVLILVLAVVLVVFLVVVLCAVLSAVFAVLRIAVIILIVVIVIHRSYLLWFIPASNESKFPELYFPGTLTNTARVNTPQLCRAARWIPRQSAAGQLISYRNSMAKSHKKYASLALVLWYYFHIVLLGNKYYNENVNR